MTEPSFTSDFSIPLPDANQIKAAEKLVFIPNKYDLRVGFSFEALKLMLTEAYLHGCSDIKIQSNDYIFVYYKRQWLPFNNRPLDQSEASKCLGFLADPSAVTSIGGRHPVDTAPEFFRDVKNRIMLRFRLHARAARVGGAPNGCAITLRTIPEKLPELSKLGLPQSLLDEILPKKGLVLMSGQTGSGKTTTIAGCLNERLKEKPGPCIICYEEPSEFAYDLTALGYAPLVPQCDIGVHLTDWDQAARTAMRSKADIILMGEVRDPKTADATAEMSITGHTVYATIHADNPHETVFRFIEFFSPEMRSAAASKFLSSLRILVSQKLIRTINDKGEVAVIPLHSWLSFDSEMKDTLQSPEWPYARWSQFVKEQVRSLGQDFASQTIPLIKDRRITVDDLKEITMMGTVEAKKFYEQHTSSWE